MDITIVDVFWKFVIDDFVCMSSLIAEAVQILVSSLADESSVVREASMASLKDIATLYSLSLVVFPYLSLVSFISYELELYIRNPLLVLDCCYAVSRGGRRVITVFTSSSCFLGIMTW